MSKVIRIRNVPNALHRTLKARAAGRGQTLSGYLLVEFERLAARLTPGEMRRRLNRRHRVSLTTPAALIIRAERDSR